eukprot:537354-Rhodomonas_salina.1
MSVSHIAQHAQRQAADLARELRMSWCAQHRHTLRWHRLPELKKGEEEGEGLWARIPCPVALPSSSLNFALSERYQ